MKKGTSYGEIYCEEIKPREWMEIYDNLTPRGRIAVAMIANSMKSARGILYTTTNRKGTKVKQQAWLEW